MSDYSNPGLHSLATIIKRLEAATSRLEDIAISSSGAAPLKREFDASASEIPPVPVIEDPKPVKAFTEVVIQAKLQPFLKLSESIGGPVWDQAQLVTKLFDDQKALIHRATASTKPGDADLVTLLKPLSDGITAIQKLKEDNRGGKHRDLFNHLSTVADGVPAAGWVAAPEKPFSVVSEAKESAQFYANRVIKEYKDKDAKHIDWVKSYTTLLEELRKYVAEYHTAGLAWNPKGGKALSWTAPNATPKAGPAAVPAPPPPPPPPAPPAPPPPTGPAATPAKGGGDISAVFADLNKGESVTSGLRKVAKEEMTHKNPSLRASGTVPERAPSPALSPGKKPLKPSKPTALAGKKPSRLAQEGTKWIVEWFENDKGLVIDSAEQNHSINLYGCKGVVLQIKGKVNAVTMANCTKTSVLVENVISTIDITKSPSFALQITGSAPTIQVDSTDSGQIYLSKDCLGVEIMTAKCSSINVSLPVEGEEEGVFVERSVPEMLRTTIKDGKLVTAFVEHTG